MLSKSTPVTTLHNSLFDVKLSHLLASQIEIFILLLSGLARRKHEVLLLMKIDNIRYDFKA